VTQSGIIGPTRCVGRRRTEGLRCTIRQGAKHHLGLVKVRSCGAMQIGRHGGASANPAGPAQCGRPGWCKSGHRREGGNEPSTTACRRSLGMIESGAANTYLIPAWRKRLFRRSATTDRVIFNSAQFRRPATPAISRARASTRLGNQGARDRPTRDRPAPRDVRGGVAILVDEAAALFIKQHKLSAPHPEL